MQEGGFSDYRANKWLAQLSTVWIGLHYADPNVSGAYASEVFGGSYARKKVVFAAPDARVMFNGESIVFKGLPSVRLTHVAGWDAQYNGNLEFYIPLTNQVTILAGKGYTIEADQLAINLP